MKLIFDQNLSDKLIRPLLPLFPGTVHVKWADLTDYADTEIWRFAAEHGFCIVTKDADFSDLSARLGLPPKVIWIRRGNCPTSEILDMLLSHYDEIIAFDNNPDVGCLVLL